jgi:hypothetical protein
LLDAGTNQEKLNSHQREAKMLSDAIGKIAGETTTKYRMQKDLLTETKKIAELKKQIDEDATRNAERLLAIQEKQRDLARARDDLDRARSDRSGGTVDGIVSDAKDGGIRNAFNRHINNVQKGLGRRLTPEEMSKAARNYMDTVNGANLISDQEAAAKSGKQLGIEGDEQETNVTYDERGIGRGRLGGPAKIKTNFTDNALNWRDIMKDVLTISESNPQAAMKECLIKISVDMSHLLQKAKTDGLLIKPIMGK